MVADYCCEVNALVAAILHDVVEDTSASVGDISNIFGCRVAQIVERLTRFQLPNYRISSGELIMRAHMLNDNVAVLIKLLDRLHNLQTIHVKTREKQQKNYLEVIETFFILAFKIDHKIVDQFQDYLNRNATTQKLQQEDSIFSYGAYQLQFLDFQNNF
jgi:(p)ppGpp synthase/HD superfamily hydrolase